MILDKGICRVYAKANLAPPGETPVNGKTLKFESWYGELHFETNPANQTPAQEDIQTVERVRVVQFRSIKSGDLVTLSDKPGKTFRIVRAFHGTDSENGQLVSDLNLWLEETEEEYDA